MPSTDTKWFYEEYKTQALGMHVSETLLDEQSEYQKLEVFENPEYGTVMVLDGCYQLSDLDEHMYHKAITTYGMQNIAPDKKDLNILVLGAGDGGVVRDLFQNWNDRIAQVTMVEIDEAVINASRKFFPQVACELDNPKLNLRCEDAIAYIANSPAASFDLVICDSTDPVGFAAGLIEEDFYRSVQRIMTEEGVYTCQSGSPIFQKEEFDKARANLGKVFNEVHSNYAPMLVYPGTFWSYTVASKQLINTANIDMAEFMK